MTTETNKPATAPKTSQNQPEEAIPDTAQDTPKTQTDIPYYTTDTWTNDLNGVWTDRNAVDTDTDADSAVTPVRYEDALGEYLGKGTDPVAGVDTPLGIDPDPDLVTPQQRVPKTKEQVISEIAPKIQKPGITSGRATIAAQEMYAEVEQRYGQDAEAVLEYYQPGQNPRKFLDGFQNAYLAGKMGNKTALKNSGVVAYLTEEQRNLAFDLGVENVPQGKSMPAEVTSADARDKLDIITTRGTTKLPQGFSAFPEGDVLNERIKNVKPDGDKFDVAMHGSPTAVAFGGTEANMSPHLLAEVIMHSEGYHGQDIRLLSCRTGAVVDGEYCFAEELANALGVTVWAPNDLIFFRKNGTFYVGENKEGSMVPYEPNDRRRIK